jgi:hypothetical protein
MQPDAFPGLMRARSRVGCVFKDYEDAVLRKTARLVNADVIVTR